MLTFVIFLLSWSCFDEFVNFFSCIKLVIFALTNLEKKNGDFNGGICQCILGGYDNVVRVWNIAPETAQILQELEGHKSFINSLAFDFSRKFLL